MSVFVLAISCLTTSNLPGFMDLTFQVPMQYCYRIGLYFHHQAHLQLDYGFHFSTASSVLLELFLCSSAVAYSAPTDLGGSSFGVLSFCLFILFMGFTKQESEKAVAPHSSTLAWKIPWTEEPGGLQSMGSLRVRHD